MPYTAFSSYMTTVFKIVGTAVVVGVLLLWMASVLPPMRFGLDAEPTARLVASPLPAADDGYVMLSGIVVYDDDREGPVPYIAYTLPNGGMRTKQLIFRDDHGCSPSAGDLPCAAGEGASFPLYPSGAPITVTGTILSDQILVESITS